MPEGTLTIKINNNHPVELIDFTESFYALGQQYSKFLIDTDSRLSPQAKLYVKEIRTGSIEAVLQDLAPLALPFLETTNTILDFASYLKQGALWLLGREERQPRLDPVDLRNISKILQPVAKDAGSQVIISGNVNIDTLNVSLSLDSVEANAIQNRVRNLLEASKQPERVIVQRVLFYWDTTKYGSKSTSVDRGSVDSIYSKPLKVIFDDEKLKYEMINREENFFKIAFIVDLEVMTINNQPSAYRIIKLHESIPRE